MSISQISLSQLQFTGADDNSGKLRRLVTELVAAEKAINSLIQQVSAIPVPTDDVPLHVLATPSGLGPDHSVAGLSVGMVLRALSSTQAAFAQLAFADLAQSDVHDPVQDDVMLFRNGYWVAGAIAEIVVGATGNNVGEGIPWYVATQKNVLQFRSVIQGDGITLLEGPESITISATGSSGGQPGTSGEDFPVLLSVTSLRL